jgi:hypothetical protein
MRKGKGGACVLHALDKVKSSKFSGPHHRNKRGENVGDDNACSVLLVLTYKLITTHFS